MIQIYKKFTRLVSDILNSVAMYYRSAGPTESYIYFYLWLSIYNTYHTGD